MKIKELKKTTQASLEEVTRKEMSKCLLKLTTSGNPSLDDAELKKFKKFCRKSDDYVRFAFALIMEQMEKKHSEIRLSAFQVANEIFTRSHAFREILVTHLQDFLTLTTGTETNHPLPPPKGAANKLKEETLRTIQQWYDSFGRSYRKLDVGYNYLKDCKHVDFQNIQAQNEAERLRAAQEEKRKQKQMADRLAKVLQHISENKPEVEDCIKESENCLKLLLPTPDDFQLFTPEDAVQVSTSCLVDNDGDKISNTEPSPLRNSNLGEEGKNCDVNKVEKIRIIKDTEKRENENKQCTSSLATSVVDVNHSKDNEEVNNDSNPTCKTGTLNLAREIGDSSNSQNIPTLDVDSSVYGVVESCKPCDDDEAMSCDEDEDETGYDSDYSDRAHGFSKPGFNITIEMPVGQVSLRETEDNMDVLQSLKDAVKLINSNFLPRVIKWQEILGKNGATQTDLKTIIGLKMSLEAIKTKCTELKLVSMEKLNDQDSDDDDDLEDVPEKEGYEATVSSCMGPDIGYSPQKSGSEKTNLKRHHNADASASNSDSKKLSVKKTGIFRSQWKIKERELEESLADPTSRATALARIKAASGDGSNPTFSSSQPSSSKSKTDNSAPFVKFGKDLAHWENPDEIEAPDIIKFDSLHRFWASGEKETEKVAQHDVGLMLNRTFNFAGQFEPVKRSCRAPLKSGKLCPRMDRVKCPFHGPIIPRDEDGSPSVKSEPGTSTAATATTSTIPTREDSEIPPWQDPVLQREIEQTTGHDLGSARSQKLLDKAKGKGKGKGKKGKKSGLTDIKAINNTSRTRLEKRVFNKRSMKRVCSNLDAADYKRVRDKFGNQFNYSL